MFVARQGPRGQSLVIAAAKWIGTLAPTILFGALAGSAFIFGLGLLCSVFDLAYIGLLLAARRGLAPRPADGPARRTFATKRAETTHP
jgi:predicted lipid-binding transport protein (Tim44 family)